MTHDSRAPFAPTKITDIRPDQRRGHIVLACDGGAIGEMVDLGGGELVLYLGPVCALDAEHADQLGDALKGWAARRRKTEAAIVPDDQPSLLETVDMIAITREVDR